MTDNRHFADPWFWMCVHEAVESGFLNEWLRLTGNRLPRSEIERMVDEVTGYGEDVARQFLQHVKEFIYDTIPHPVEVVNA